MTVGIAQATAVAILKVFAGTAYAAVSTCTAKLHVGDPGAAGTANPSLGSAATNAVAWTTPTTPTMNASAVPAWTNGGTSENISHVSLWNGATFLQSIALTTPQAWVGTNTLTLTALSLNYSPIAA